jgi:DNA-3-methyladenine glycosylase
VTRLSRAFFARPTLTVLDDIIGKVLVHDSCDGRTAGIIIEAEAYIGEDDPACHAAPGRTKRNAPLYGAPGLAYVYLNYGVHYLVNVVTEPEGFPAAVLIRALESVEGAALMRARRLAAYDLRLTDDSRLAHDPRLTTDGLRSIKDADLCKGPGNLTKAMGIGPSHNGDDLIGGALRIEDWGVEAGARVYSSRIGIRVGVERPWRCHWRAHASVSGRASVNAAADAAHRPGRRPARRSARSGRSASARRSER